MKAAIVTAAGNPPVYGDFEEPIPGAGEARIHVRSAALTHLVRMRASGRHYSSAGQFPFVVGVDGVGALDDGRRVCFVLPRAPFGAMGQQTVVAETQIVPVPDDLDDISAAAIANPGMSSWAALAERARLKAGETVLVNGATGASGQLAVRIARYLGAARVIATGRNREVLRALEADGADVVIPLEDDEAALEARFKAEFARGVDVVLDYLWGPSARALLHAAAKAGREGVPMRFVQIGSMGGAEISLPAAVLRSSAIELMGSGIGSVPLERLVAAIGGVLQAAVPAGLTLQTHVVPLAQVSEAWQAREARTVFAVA